MKEIKELARNIREEIHDAEKYIDLAMETKSDYSSLADLYYTLCKEELGHANKLHGEAVKLIEKMRDTRRVPETMMDIWAFEHEMLIRDEMDVKRKVERYQQM